MSETKQSLVCIATGHGNEWEAFCLDFDLAVQGNSFEEVRGFLHEAIRVYVESALAEQEPDRSRLLARKAPFFVRFSWGWRLFWLTIFGRTRRDENATVEFPIACPA
jgi:predicted RNase H-like HicB family nuclease